MELAIQEGCGSPITCPDMVCLNHGTLQEAEVSILLSFSFSLFFFLQKMSISHFANNMGLIFSHIFFQLNILLTSSTLRKLLLNFWAMDVSEHRKVLNAVQELTVYAL